MTPKTAMKHIVILIACAMLSACKEKPEVQTNATWTTNSEQPSAYSNYVYPKLTNHVTEMIVFGMRLTNAPGLIVSTNGNVLVGGNWPTNIVINNNYSGTVQIGTNFATVKELDTWVTVLSSMKSVAEAWPVITNENPLTAFTEYRRFTYTVDVGKGLWTHTNVIDIERCSDYCVTMRYVDNGITNDFHAAFSSFTVKTNSP